MPVRTASAVWMGDIATGKGLVKVSDHMEGEYSVPSRFKDGAGTNPEELIGAAHAGCYSMALSAGLSKAGFKPNKIETTANVHIEKVGEGFKITKIELHSRADVPGIDKDTFHQQAEAAKTGCPVSQALTGTDISLHAELV
ncbi:MAG: OsmC family protein [Candidatus Krumholzibacteria bacterium]|nr:OsmC family protein [Candidatus Krumholzibacteria bacterium]